MKKILGSILNLFTTMVIFYLAYVVVYAFNAKIIFWGAVAGSLSHIAAYLLIGGDNEE